MIFIYKITNKINSKVYIGLTKDLERRFKEHKTGKGSKSLYRDILKYGEDNFDFSVLEEVNDYNQAALKEIQYISNYDALISGYNKTPGGEIPETQSLKEKKNKKKKKSKRNKVFCKDCIYAKEIKNDFFCRKLKMKKPKEFCFRGKEKGSFAF